MIRGFGWSEFLFLLGGLRWTIVLSIIAFTGGFALGLPVACLRTAPHVPLRWSMRAFIVLFQGTPVLMQLFIAYYGLSVCTRSRHRTLDGCNARPHVERWRLPRRDLARRDRGSAAWAMGGGHQPRPRLCAMSPPHHPTAGVSHLHSTHGWVPRPTHQIDRDRLPHWLRRAHSRWSAHDQRNLPAAHHLPAGGCTVFRALLAAHSCQPPAGTADGCAPRRAMTVVGAGRCGSAPPSRAQSSISAIICQAGADGFDEGDVVHDACVENATVALPGAMGRARLASPNFSLFEVSGA